MSDPDDKDEANIDLVALQRKAKTLTKEELDRDLAEISGDIHFLERQIEADLNSYSSNELSVARGRIAHLKRMAELLEAELVLRNKKV